MPVLLDVVKRFFCTEIPGDVSPVAYLVIACHERDLARSKQLVRDVPVEGLLVGFDCQQEVGPLLRTGLIQSLATGWFLAGAEPSPAVP
jgi:hypothetical protein